eukprot:TRINITY_DN3726_c0_g2_i12.p2 TRINITY_DN3726_c0_g2~~TRINITY_DN3726_c0_g2_i12.p2  ORF type:complete len:570 (-),score=58.92 TRINITY_DN3726_c0_g2_i12:1201-2910(-)
MQSENSYRKYQLSQKCGFCHTAHTFTFSCFASVSLAHIMESFDLIQEFDPSHVYVRKPDQQLQYKSEHKRTISWADESNDREQNLKGNGLVIEDRQSGLPRVDSKLFRNGKKGHNGYSGYGNVKAVVALAVPALGSVLADPVMQLVDTACVGQISSLQLAALGPNTAIFNLVFQVFQFLGVATANVIATDSPWAPGISTNEKLNRLVKARRLISHAFTAAAVMGVALCALLEMFGQWLLILVGANQEIIPVAMQFLRIRALATPGVLVSSAAWGVCIGQQDALTPLLVYATAGVINLVVDLYLVLYINMGIRGAAIATTSAQYISTVLLIVYISRQARKGKGVGFSWAGLPRYSELRPFLGVASALLLRTVFTMWAYTTVSAAASMLGTIETAAHQVALQIFWFLAFIPEPLSLSAQSLIARDSDDPLKVKSLTLTLLKAGAICGIGLAFVVWVTYMFGLSLFTSDVVVRVTTAPLLYPTMIAVTVASIVMMIDGVSIGSSDFGYLPKTNLIASLVTSIMLFIGHWCGYGLLYVWWSLTAFFFVRLVLHVQHHVFNWKRSPFGQFQRTA